jgi:hypothetical protein
MHVQGPFAKTFAFYEDIQIERPASTGKSCNTFGGLPPIRDLRWMKSEYEYAIRAAKWLAANVRNDKRVASVIPSLGRPCNAGLRGGNDDGIDPQNNMQKQ